MGEGSIDDKVVMLKASEKERAILARVSASPAEGRRLAEDVVHA